MNKQDVIDFFNRCAPEWDADMIRNEAVIAKILDAAGIRPGVQVLDVACGTGVLIPDYLARGVAEVTGVDISPEMVKIARGKFQQKNVSILCGDVEAIQLSHRYDCCVVYNAFPHFPDPDTLIQALAGHLKPDGRLTIAHGMSRAAIDQHHHGGASKVSVGLMHEDSLAERFAPWFDVDVKISDDEKYIVSGRLR